MGSRTSHSDRRSVPQIAMPVEMRHRRVHISPLLSGGAQATRPRCCPHSNEQSVRWEMRLCLVRPWLAKGAIARPDDNRLLRLRCCDVG